MADQETTVPMDDKELFSSAMADEPVQETAEPEVRTEGEQPRDEHGRFAPKTEGEEPKVEAQAEVKVEPTQEAPKEEQDGQVPSWRLREIREERDAIARDRQETARNLAVAQEQLRQFHARLQQFENPQKTPDPFEAPQEFLNHGVRQAIDPVQQRIDQVTEHFSRRDAIREHGEKAVQDAYQALAQGVNGGDPEANSVLQRARSSMDPFGEVMKWHSQRTVFSTIGKDPEAWFQKKLEESFKDPAFQAKALERLQGNASQVGSDGRPAIKLPPSLNKVTGTGMPSGLPSDGDMSDRGLFRQAVDSPRR